MARKSRTNCYPLHARALVLLALGAPGTTTEIVQRAKAWGVGPITGGSRLLEPLQADGLVVGQPRGPGHRGRPAQLWSLTPAGLVARAQLLTQLWSITVAEATPAPPVEPSRPKSWF